MRRRAWWGFGAGLLLLVLFKFAAIDWYLAQEPRTLPAEPVSCADGASFCMLPNGARLRFLSPPVQGQAFALALEGVASGEPSAEFAMRSMDMGFNRYRFVRAHGRWEARVILPACVNGRHDWLLTLNLGDRRYLLPFSAR
jgi:hypothetical protein